MPPPPDATSRIPLVPPPPGITPNFVDPQTLAPAVLAVSIVMMTMAVLFVVIRLYGNFRAPRGLGIEDYFCIIATVTSIAFTGVVISMNYMARHIFDIPLIWVDGYYLQLGYVETILATVTFSFAKSTIFLLYLRIFAVDTTLRYCVWFGLFWTFLLYGIDIPLMTIFCTPRNGKTWDSLTFDNHCHSNVLYTLIQGVLAVVLDIYIFVLPIPIVLRLQMPSKRRLSTLGIFGTAILGITAAVVGTVYRVKLYTTDDPFWASACLFICVICENYIAIIVGSMPAFASFFRGKGPGATWLSSMNSLVLKSRASSRKLRPSHRSNTGIPSVGEPMKPASHARDKGYLELHDIGHLGDDALRSVSTVIRGDGTATRTLEEGVVHKTIDVHQSMMRDLSAAQG